MVYGSIASLCPTFFSVLDSVSCRHRAKRTMWKAAVIVLLLLSMDMQVKGAVDKTKGGSVAENPRPEETKETKGNNNTPASDTASSGFLGNLLVVPMDGSHWVAVKALAQEMGRRGHRVTVVMPEVKMMMGPGKHYDTVIYPVPYDMAFIESIMASNKDLLRPSTESFTEKIRKRFSQIQSITGLIHASAESLLFNASLISHLAQQVSPTNTEVEHNIRIGCKLPFEFSTIAVHFIQNL